MKIMNSLALNKIKEITKIKKEQNQNPRINKNKKINSLLKHWQIKLKKWSKCNNIMKHKKIISLSTQ